jgi:predicted dehydrogenase
MVTSAALRKDEARRKRRDEKASKDGRETGKVRYAVVGLGHIAQVAVLPAFAHAKGTCRLAALVSDDTKKLGALGRKYRVSALRSYDDYDELLASGEIDAVYIALPNHLHADYSIRAARAGVHVLCEKPLAVNADEAERSLEAAEGAGVKLMTAYRLHFERANLEAIEILRSGRIGEPRYFHSQFSFQLEDEENIRLDAERGGGPLLDLGVYCVNAARYLFRDEPLEVAAFEVRRPDSRFAEVPEMASAILRFPEERLASFTCSFGSADVSAYRVVGTEGDLALDPAFSYTKPLEHLLKIGGRRHRKTYKPRDQFAPELEHFAECILDDRDPEPDGYEGLADLRVLDAIARAAREKRTVPVDAVHRERRPVLEQAKTRPRVSKPETVRVRSPHG